MKPIKTSVAKYDPNKPIKSPREIAETIISEFCYSSTDDEKMKDLLHDLIVSVCKEQREACVEAWQDASIYGERNSIRNAPQPEAP